jgi:hypothetical protein
MHSQALMQHGLWLMSGTMYIQIFAARESGKGSVHLPISVGQKTAQNHIQHNKIIPFSLIEINDFLHILDEELKALED